MEFIRNYLWPKTAVEVHVADSFYENHPDFEKVKA